MKWHVEGWKDSGFELGFRHEVVFSVVELEVYYLVDLWGIGVAQIIEDIEMLSVIFQFCIFCFGRYEVQVVFPLIFPAELGDGYTSFTWVVTSGA